MLQGLTASNFLAVLSYVSLPHPVLTPTFASKTAGTEFRVRLSNPYEGKKVKAFAKEKVWVLGSRVQSTLNGVHSTIARARSSVCRTRPFAFAEQKHPERTSNFRFAKVPPFRQLLLLTKSKILCAEARRGFSESKPLGCFGHFCFAKVASRMVQK